MTRNYMEFHELVSVIIEVSRTSNCLQETLEKFIQSLVEGSSAHNATMLMARQKNPPKVKTLGISREKKNKPVVLV